MMKNYIIKIGLILIFIILNLILYAQNQKKIDSLFTVLKTAKQDTTCVNAYASLCREYLNFNNDTSMYFGSLGLKIASKANYKKGMSKCYNNIGNVQLYQRNYDQALEYYLKSLKIYEELNDKKGISDIYFNIGVVYEEMSNYNKSLEYYLKSLKIYEESGDKNEMPTCYTNIGNIHLHQSNYDKALAYYLKSLKIYEESNNKNEMSICYINIGNVYLYQGNYNKALEYYLKSLKIREESNNKKGMSTCYINIGNVYLYQGNYDKALAYYLKSLKIREEIGDKNEMSNCYSNIGLVYYYQGNYDKTLEYYLKSLKIKEEIGDKQGMSSCYTNIGNVYLYRGNYNKALEYYLKSLKICEELVDKKEMSTCYMNIGIIHSKKGNYNKAIEYYLKSLKIKEEIGDKDGIAIALSNIAELHIDIADSLKTDGKTAAMTAHYNQAVAYGLKSIQLIKEIKAMPLENNAANILMTVYEKLGNYKESVKYARIFIITNDSMFKEEKTKALAEMSAKYQSEKKQLEIEKMQKQKELDNKTMEAQTAENRKQQIIIFSAVGGFLIVLIFSVIILRMFRQKRKANILLATQNTEIRQQKEEISAQRDEISIQRDLVTTQKEHIEEIHKEVTDSINYAERIQRSFLATTELLNENLNDYFVFFHPKDVVSGDFYWAGKLDNGNFALATADSTGHGVPGAIMSILNISSLEKAVEYGLCEPSEILNKTRKTIIERLKKDGSIEGGKDGMDASLICFDFANQKFTYSAANNTIWVIRDNTLIELSSDKMPVGKHDNDQTSFTQHEFQIQKGDVIYTLTDGMSDQFGGSKGKKFMSKNLKILLTANNQQPMAKQKEILDSTLENWMNNNGIKYEQTDDITIMGIRI